MTWLQLWLGAHLVYMHVFQDIQEEALFMNYDVYIMNLAIQDIQRHAGCSERSHQYEQKVTQKFAMVLLLLYTSRWKQLMPTMPLPDRQCESAVTWSVLENYFSKLFK